MNWYEHHIGDYDKNTSHLTACEDGIYCRLLRRYYDKEQPLEADVEKIKRWARARAEDERAAVDAILGEFFHLEADGWHHDKADEVIAAYKAGEPEREAKKRNEDTRLSRHRQERAELFTIVNSAGMHAPYNIPMGELRALADTARSVGQTGRNVGQTESQDRPGPEFGPGSVSGGVSGGVSGRGDFPSVATPPETPATQPATATATLATATQPPLPTTQSPLPIDPVVNPDQQQLPGGDRAIPPADPDEGQKAGKPEIPPCPHQKLIALWHDLLPLNPRVERWTETRSGYARQRWKEIFVEGRTKGPTEADGLHWFRRWFGYIAKSKFLTGRAGSSTPGRPAFVAELDWVLRPENFTKIIEGKYHTTD